jgi:hypothetical protein
MIPFSSSKILSWEIFLVVHSRSSPVSEFSNPARTRRPCSIEDLILFSIVTEALWTL